ncbi:MAG: hypothetical protein J6C89_06380 [Clostridia bacterium]|nr:hypothetical protein [Clostridia bacterium]
MKKIAALLLALTMVISIVACGGNNETTTETTVTTETTATTDATTTADNTTTAGTTEATTTQAPVTSTVTLDVISNAIVEKVAELTNNELFVMGSPMEAGYLPWFNNDVTGFSECYVTMPMIGTIPFISYVFRVSDASEAEAFLAKLNADFNLRYVLCNPADTTVTAIHGDLVFLTAFNSEQIGANAGEALKGAFEAAVK